MGSTTTTTITSYTSTTTTETSSSSCYSTASGMSACSRKKREAFYQFAELPGEVLISLADSITPSKSVEKREAESEVESSVSDRDAKFLLPSISFLSTVTTSVVSTTTSTATAAATVTIGFSSGCFPDDVMTSLGVTTDCSSFSTSG